MRKEEEKPISVYIPPNFEAGLNIFGISDNIETLIDGGVLVALPYIVIFGLGLLKGISLTNRNRYRILLCPCTWLSGFCWHKW